MTHYSTMQSHHNCAESPLHTFRGSATELRLRKELGMQGLLPASQAPLQAEIDRAHAAISRSCSPLDKYQVSTPQLEFCLAAAACAEAAVSLPVSWEITCSDFLSPHEGVKGKLSQEVEVTCRQSWDSESPAGISFMGYSLSTSRSICQSSIRRTQPAPFPYAWEPSPFNASYLQISAGDVTLESHR